MHGYDLAGVRETLNGAASVTYTPRLSQRFSAGADRFFHQDWLGSSPYVTDLSQTTQSAADWSAYGRKEASTGEAYSSDFQWGGSWGYQQDPDANLGLTLMGQRYYDPEVGRFISEDPIGFGGGLNLYAYCEADPINFTDPLGLKGLGRLIGGILGGIAGSFEGGIGAIPGSAAGAGLGAYIEDRLSGSTFQQAAGNGIIEAGETYIVGRLFGGISQGYAAIRARQAAQVAEGVAARGAVVNANRIFGKAVEDRLRAMVGGVSKTFSTPLGNRIVDAFAGGVAHESKTGSVCLSSFVEQQIAKDAALLKAGRVSGVVWHFYPNAAGVRQVSKPVLDRLAKEGIGVVFH